MELTFDEVEKRLGNHYVILTGSAVSEGLWEEAGFLPGVRSALQAIFDALFETTIEETYLAHLVKDFFFKLARKDYSGIPSLAKFEELLWRSEKAIGKRKVSKLLKALFYCDDSEFNHNHFALKVLLSSGRARANFTTNFDNGVKRANPKIKLRYHHLANPPRTLPRSNFQLKLHGDVTTGEYIATTETLLHGRRRNSFSYLPNQLGKTVLVAGYSGFGDVDIYPHLKNANGTRFIWVVRKGSKPPHIASDYVVCDLYSPSPDENLLVYLARSARLPSKYKRPDWKKKVKEWAKTITFRERVKLLNALFQGYSGWGLLQLYQFTKNHGRPPVPNKLEGAKLLDFLDQCIAIGNYQTPTKHFSRLKRHRIFKKKSHKYKMQVGYNAWRMADLRKASRYLRLFTRTRIDSQEKDRALKSYVNVWEDIIKQRPRNRRKAILQASGVYHAIRELLKDRKRTMDPADGFTARIAELSLDYFVTGKGDVRAFVELYEEARDLNLWTPAKFVGIALMRINPFLGFRLLYVYPGRPSLLDWHTVKHSLLACLDSLPWIGFWFSAHVNIVLSKAPSLVREKWQFRKMKEWHLEGVQWAIDNQKPVV